MKDYNQQYQDGLQIDISPVEAKGVYSNIQVISHSATEFVFDFISMLPGLEKAQVASRVIVAPAHAKNLLDILQENILKYEQEYGRIEMPKQEPRTATPFGNIKNEA